MGFVGNIKQTAALNLKNIIGWKTKRKIIIFSVDDYGNVRLDSKQARDKMFANGIKATSRFDLYDTLETSEDLEVLYETLTSVKDKNGRHPVFTAFAMSANIDFEAMRGNGYASYSYEALPVTFSKLKGYERTWELWQEGMKKGILQPQFHGREHLNIKVLMEALKRKDKDALTCFDNRSYTGINDTGYSTIAFPAAFDFYEFEENETLKEIIRDGLQLFEKNFGFKATDFTPSASTSYSHVLEPVLHEGGIKSIHMSRIKKEHLGKGKFGPSHFFYTGKKNASGQYYLVRNCVFEPTEKRGLDWVEFCMQQIEASFRWNLPANISSHRVNFCGLVDEHNRKEGIAALQLLLKKITQRWPDAEFMSSAALGELVASDKS